VEDIYKILDPASIPTNELHAYLLGSIAPRPICFASTMDKNGNVNLSPFSFFNVFGSNPPIMIFSPARRVRDNTIKHTLENVFEVDEVVINVVNYDMVEQASLASCEYPKGVNEFEKAGFTPIKSLKVKPPRVAESPASFECKVKEIIRTGEKGGAGNLIICEVLVAYIKKEVLDEKGKIDPHKIDLVARMGADWYCRASGEAVFEVPKPNSKLGIGFDKLPEDVRKSNILTGNNLGRLANEEKLPGEDEIEEFRVALAFTPHSEESVHRLAQEFLNKHEVRDAWKLLLLWERMKGTKN
jgi:flavin reductase (DIM6/NTAB) family NADH-FMN oxidoreductase RutF